MRFKKNIARFVTAVLLLLAFLSNVGMITVHAASSEISGPDVIYKQQDKILTTNTIKGLLKSSSEIKIIEDTYTGFGHIPGTYHLTFSSSDEIKKIEVNVKQVIHEKVIAVVVEKGVPVIWINKDQELLVERKNNEIVTVLQKIGLVTVTSYTQPHIITNDYSENAKSPGLYTFELNLLSSDGSEQYILFKIKVTNSETISDGYFIGPENEKKSISTVLYVMGGLVIGISAIIYATKIKKEKTRRRK